MSRTSPYRSSIPSMRLRISGNDSTAEAMSRSRGYCPSLHPAKKLNIFRRVSKAPRSSTSEGRSIWENGLRSGTRKGMQSGYPDVGNEASNIRMTRISSVRPRRRSISEDTSETCSLSALSRPYPVEQRAAMDSRILSKASLLSIFAVLVMEGMKG